MSECQIKYGKFEDVELYVNMAKKERVSMANPKGAIWLIADWNGQLAGFACMAYNGAGVARFKSDYVLRENRGCGLYAKLFAARMILAKIKNIKRATAFCTPMSLPIYFKYGFKPRTKIGDIVFVERLFI